MTRVDSLLSVLWSFAMQLTMFDVLDDSTPPSSSGKTSPASSLTKQTASDASLRGWLETMKKSSLHTESGKSRVWSWDQKDLPSGESLTPSSSEWLNDAEGSSSLVYLSDILEHGKLPQQYFLSARACAGILRRAVSRGKELPTILLHALQAVAGELIGEEIPEVRTL